MISEYIIMLIVACILVVISIGIFWYFHAKRLSKMFEDSKSEFPKSLVGLSAHKIIEMPVRKEKKPLYIFEKGKKTEYKLKK